MPCPSRWFANFAQLVTAAETLRCSVFEAYHCPLWWRAQALKYRDVMERAKPGLEQIAQTRARMKMEENRLLGR